MLVLNAVPIAEGSVYEDVLLFSTKNWSFLEFPYIFKEIRTQKTILDKTSAGFFMF